jgi:hypothetical protein
MSFENSSSNLPDKIVSSNEFKLSEAPDQSSHQLIQSNKTSDEIPSSSSKNIPILYHNYFPEQNPSLTNHITFDSNSSLSHQNIYSPPFISNTPNTITSSSISSLPNIPSYQPFVPKRKSYLQKSDFVKFPLTNSITPNLNPPLYKNTAFHNSDSNNSHLSIHSKSFIPKPDFKLDYIYEIENGIIGIRRDCFLKLIQYMEYSNGRKLKAV